MINVYQSTAENKESNFKTIQIRCLFGLIGCDLNEMSELMS